MALYNDEIAPGFETSYAGNFTNFEDLFPSGQLYAPLRVPLGSETVKTVNGNEITDGDQVVELRQLGDPFGFNLHEELDDYIDLIFGGDWDLENAECTLRTQNRDASFSYYDAIAHLPRLGADYQHVESDASFIRDLVLRFTILNSTTVT